MIEGLGSPHSTPGTYIPTEYLPLVLLMMVAFAVGAGALLVGTLVRLRRPYRDKLLPYESGNEPVGEPRSRFTIQFYLIAMLFVIFDVEAVFVYPWAVVYGRIGLYAVVEMMLFIGLLVIGFVYAWKKGAFQWE